MLALGFLFLVVSTTYAYQNNHVHCQVKTLENSAYKIPKHACACNVKTAGTLRYHDNQIQFCNGKEYVNVVGAVAIPQARLGSKENPGRSCNAILGEDSSAKSGVYYLNLNGKEIRTYCYMEEMCGSRGWALIMKINGGKTTFSYNSAYWTNKVVYNPAGAAGGLDDKETKLETYSDLPFNALCLGMKVKNTRKWLKLPQKASSLYSLIADNKYRATRLGRNAWKGLVPGSSLQRNCNREGFNVRVGDASMARIGIISNQENNCASPDSRVGFGTAGHYCGQNKNHSAGNEARCSPDNGDRSTPSIGYILAQ